MIIFSFSTATGIKLILARRFEGLHGYITMGPMCNAQIAHLVVEALIQVIKIFTAIYVSMWVQILFRNYLGLMN